MIPTGNLEEDSNMKKLFSLLLALILVLSLIPMAAVAATSPVLDPLAAAAVKNEDKDAPGKKEDKTEGKHDKDDHKDKHDKKDHHKKKLPVAIHKPNEHSYSGYGCNTAYHWLQCACGCRISVEPHIDPKDAPDDYCTCGYHFNDNADLVTLWIDGCPPIKGFNKNKTEYKLNAYTYKDVKEIKVSTTTYASEATVELPEDLTLKEGENKFDIKVIAENQKVTKVYTVIIHKEAKK